MTVDFTTYQPPGVFVEEDLSTLVSVAGLTPTVVAIVGPGRGHRLGNETIVMDDDDGIQLQGEGVDLATVVVTATDGTEYVVDVDYSLDADPDAPTYTLLIREVAGGIGAGETVFVTYEYTDTDYYNPLRVFDFDDVQAAYGPPLDLSTGAITSALSFAAKIAFDNGAREIVCVATEGDMDVDVASADLVTGYAKLSTIYDIDIIVPLPVGITGSDATPGDTYTVGTDLRTHLINMEGENLFRIGIVGYESDVTILPVTTATNISHKRVVLAWPQVLRYYHGFTNTTIDVSGYYLAAAYAGRIASNPIQMPLTKKQIVSFNGFSSSVLQTMTNTVKNAWSAGGVAVTEMTRNGDLVVRHGTTTDRTNTNSREISLVRARDNLINLIQDTVDGAGLIGSWIDGDTPGQVKSIVAGALEVAVDADLIVQYNDLKARQLTSDPSVIEVKFQYIPAYPLNYIVISFSINTETGETTVNEEGA